MDIDLPFYAGARKLQVVSQEKWLERTTELVQLDNRLIMRKAK